MPLYDRKRARRSLLDTAVFRVLSQAATLLGYIVMVRGMSEHDFGIYNLLYAVVPVISTVASLGLEHTLRRYQPEYLRAGNHAAAARLVSVVAGARFAANLVVLSLILLVWDSVAPFFQLGPYRHEFVVFGLIVLLHFQARVLQLSLASHMLHRYGVGMLAVLSTVRLIAYSAFVLFGELTLQAAILSDIAAYAIAYAGLAMAYRRHCRPAPIDSFRFHPRERRRLLRYAFLYNFNDAGTAVLSVRSDNFFIAALMSPIAVGTYSFYTRLARMAGNILPVRLFENVVHPLFFATRPEDAGERMPRYFTTLLNTNLLAQVPVLAYGIVYHREIVAALFGGKFVESSLLLPIVLAFGTANAISTPVTLVAQYTERAGIILLSKIFAVYNVIALLVLIPRAGVLGAVLATGSAELFKNLYIWWHVRHLARWTNVRGMLVSSLVIWGTFIAIGVALKAVLKVPPVVHLACGAALALVASLVYVRSAALSAADRRLFASVLHGREAQILRWIGLLPGQEPQKAR